MKYGDREVTAPGIEPVTLSQAKDQVDVPACSTEWDSKLTRYIRTARQQVELYAGRSFITTVREMTLRCWPNDRVVLLNRSPAQSVDSIVYLDEDGNPQTLANTEYEVDLTSEPAQVWFNSGDGSAFEPLPDLAISPNAIKVTFKAGYGDTRDDVPELAKDAILMMVEGLWHGCESDAAMSLVQQLQVGEEFACYG